MMSPDSYGSRRRATDPCKVHT